MTENQEQTLRGILHLCDLRKTLLNETLPTLAYQGSKIGSVPSVQARMDRTYSSAANLLDELTDLRDEINVAIFGGLK